MGERLNVILLCNTFDMWVVWYRIGECLHETSFISQVWLFSLKSEFILHNSDFFLTILKKNLNHNILNENSIKWEFKNVNWEIQKNNNNSDSFTIPSLYLAILIFFLTILIIYLIILSFSSQLWKKKKSETQHIKWEFWWKKSEL